MIDSILLFATVGLLGICWKTYFTWKQREKSVNNLPGHRNFLSLISFYNELVPAIPGLSVGPLHFWRTKHENFRRWDCDAFSSISVYPLPLEIVFADAEAIKEMASARLRFQKPVERYRITKSFGNNVVASDEDEWKRHRKVCAPAFSEESNRFVFAEAVRIMAELFETAWKDKKVIKLDNVKELTVAITFMLISNAGFGHEMSWEDNESTPTGHYMPFKVSLELVTSNPLVRVFCPKWALNLSSKWRSVDNAFLDLPLHLQELVDERRRTGNVSLRHDLLSRLIDASEQEVDGKIKLADNEIISNSFIFFLAGHETTAHTLAFALGLLALYPKEQEKMYEQIERVFPKRSIPAYEDLEKLTQVSAVLYESMRLYPVVPFLAKRATEDSTFSVGSITGKRRAVFVPKGTYIIWDIAGVHYNPRYWKNPNDFRPDRFHEDWPRDAFLPFSSGGRACLGRRFAQTESIIILAMLISRFRVEVIEEPEFSNETLEQRKERIFRAKAGVTVTPIRVPLVFKARQ